MSKHRKGHGQRRKRTAQREAAAAAAKANSEAAQKAWLDWTTAKDEETRKLEAGELGLDPEGRQARVEQIDRELAADSDEYGLPAWSGHTSSFRGPHPVTGIFRGGLPGHGKKA
jgi:hypothetical protein